MTFGEELKRLREERGLTQKQLATACGVSQPVFGRLEKADFGSVKVATLYAICAALGVSADHFASFFPQTDEPTPTPQPKPNKPKGKKK